MLTYVQLPAKCWQVSRIHAVVSMHVQAATHKLLCLPSVTRMAQPRDHEETSPAGPPRDKWTRVAQSTTALHYLLCQAD